MSVKQRTDHGGYDPHSNGYVLLGIDEDGSSHVYRMDDKSVHVVGDDGREHREDLAQYATKNVDTWMAFIDVQRGWSKRWYHATLGESMAAWLGGEQ